MTAYTSDTLTKVLEHTACYTANTSETATSARYTKAPKAGSKR